MHRWRGNERNTVAPIAAVSQTASPSGFVAVSFHPETPPPAEPMPLPDIRIELQRGNAAAVVHWPVQAAASCAAWLHEWLR
ncbi:IS66 family insertion sequence element accessory protein TnpB [Variovorax sp. RTB1]|uniref:IS66 family insertion sequence element accessory protein TnpB n=1 Tax=Variovorax sp. RTB1 TaxID=3048631 RepID=UPI002B225CAA|nr:IS66 family insertion sequence element accessory protein TnpB [Variovorax sp. RTB1]